MFQMCGDGQQIRQLALIRGWVPAEGDSNLFEAVLVSGISRDEVFDWPNRGIPRGNAQTLPIYLEGELQDGDSVLVVEQSVDALLRPKFTPGLWRGIDDNGAYKIELGSGRIEFIRGIITEPLTGAISSYRDRSVYKLLNPAPQVPPTLDLDALQQPQ